LNQPQVSVIVPTHNRLVLLQRALWSILGQKGVDLEVIVVDDASQDETPNWLAQVSDPRVRVVRHEYNRYVSAALNSGVAVASGEWLAFCDDDDIWAPDKLRAELSAVEQATGAQWVACGAVCVDSRLEILQALQTPEPGDVARVLLAHNAIPGGGSGVLARAALVRDVGGFDVSVRWCQDWDLWIRLSLRSPIAVVNRPLMAYFMHEGSSSAQTTKHRADIDLIYAKYAAARREYSVRLDRADFYAQQAYIDLRAGRRWSAARNFLGQAWHGGGIAAVRPAVAGALAPHHLTRRQVTRHLRYIPAGWLDEVEPWLTEIRGRPELTDGPVGNHS
jgi:glycosyltransferase involved in cell wall biosynthesis